MSSSSTRSRIPFSTTITSFSSSNAKVEHRDLFVFILGEAFFHKYV